MYQELSRVDPETARRLHPRDSVKVLRALEVYRQTGVPLSRSHRESRETCRTVSCPDVGVDDGPGRALSPD